MTTILPVPVITILPDSSKGSTRVHRARPSGIDLIRRPLLCCALGFGAGLAPRAPGTVGTLVAIPIVILLAQGSNWLLPLVALVFFAAGIYICSDASKYYGSHDHSSIVWDEIVGYMIALSFVAVSLETILIGFILFRLLDILKPWPISWVDRNVPGAWGIMLDDVAAGLVANAGLQLWLRQSWLVL